MCIYFANATGIQGYFYYVNFAGNSNDCQIEGFQKNYKNCDIYFSFYQKWVIYRHIVPLKHVYKHVYRLEMQKFFLFLCCALTS